MKHNQATANQCAADAEGKCAACQRHGLKVFLLRQAIIAKNKTDGSPNGEPIYLELAHYMAQLNFTGRMPDETLSDYQYILRTIRDGYVYVMQQHGTDSASRVIEAYESIDGALRRKNAYSLPGSKPRPLPKACRNLHHSVPAAFIHLDEQQYTEAWIGYSQRPWSKETIDGYLTEQDVTALSRFSHVDLTTFKQDQSAATNNRAVPFADIFGYLGDNNVSPPSKVLEFRFAKDSLPYFDSVDGFNSRQAERTRYASHVHDLYKKDKSVSSSAIVIEDLFAIAEELNGQRIKFCDYYFNAPEPTIINEPYEPLSAMGRFNKNSQDKYFEARAKNILKTVNPELKKLAYFSDNIFKKRLIKLYTDKYINGMRQSYDSQIIKEQRVIDIERARLIADYNNQANHQSAARRVSPSQAHMQASNKKTYLEKQKKEKVGALTDRINQQRVDEFEKELQPYYDKLLEHYKKHAVDYYTYTRWLFGQATNKLLANKKNISTFAATQPSSFELTQFWRREFNFSLIGDKNFNLTLIYKILYSGTQLTYLDEHYALWDELQSNPESILYVVLYQDKSGFNLLNKSFKNIGTDEAVSVSDIVTNLISNIGSLVIGIDAEKLKPYENEIAIREQQLAEINGAKISLQEDMVLQQEELKKLKEEYRQLNRQALSESEINRLRLKINELRESSALNRVYLERINEGLIQVQEAIKSTKMDMETTKSSNQSLINERTRLTQFEAVHTRLTTLMTEEAAQILKINDKQMISSRLVPLHGMQYLANKGVFSIEFQAKARIGTIDVLSLKLAEMQMMQFRDVSQLSTAERLVWQKSMPISYQELSAEGKMANFKFTLSFNNPEIYQLFITFLNEQGIANGNVLNPHQLNKFITEKLPAKLQQHFANQLNSVNQGVSQSAEKINELNAETEALTADLAKLEQEQFKVSATSEQLKQDANINDKIYKQQTDLHQERHIKELAYSVTKGKLYQDLEKLRQQTTANVQHLQRSLMINGAINGFVGYLTINSIIDNIKQLSTMQPAEKEYLNEKALLTNITSLTMTTIDMIAQSGILYLNSRLLTQIEAKSVNLLAKTTAKIAIMDGISFGVNRIFAGITIYNALAEIGSSFLMGDIENKEYHKKRIVGGILEVFGAVVLLGSSPLAIIAGLLLVLFGNYLVEESYALDRWTPIEHWLNRIQFGQQAELAYFKYDAYGEETSLAKFGYALNDYFLAIEGIDGLISSKPTLARFDQLGAAMSAGDIDVELYLAIPNFAFHKPHDYIICEVVFAKDSHSLITLYYFINQSTVRQLPTVTLYPKTSNFDIGTSFSYNQQEPTESIPTQIYTIRELELEADVVSSNQLQLQLRPNKQEAIEQNRQVGDEGTLLVVKKPIAKANQLSQVEYGLTILYYQPDSDELPLVIKKTGKL
ncbi:hypothetical protein RHO12_11695 [Orbus sturtevantii]|uniref:toxin VasX n=1 Tax=Orbus sturtevantii TaxID=3074109 RepID=UPI00370D21A5